MQMTTVLAIFLVLQCCVLCFSIRVPLVWNNGVVQQKEPREKFAVESFKPYNGQQKFLPIEYFEYPAKKPQFAVDVADSHGVKSPEKLYKSSPVKPYTEVEKPQLGVHRLQNNEKDIFKPYQKYVKTITPKHAIPISSNYEVFHPYKAEEPVLQEIYKDPVLLKIRHDLENSNNKLQHYENDDRPPEITKEEYLESPEQTEKKLFPQKNVPVEYENHKPQRRPMYYEAEPISNYRDQILNHKLKHPWNQNYIKIKPIHYHPIKNHIRDLRQQHASKYDDERNEYPQIEIAQNIAEPQEGFDIYERGKQKYTQLRNNFDEAINKAVLENRPAVYDNLEIQNNEAKNDDEEEEEEFVPIKNYAQVRKTDTIKHLPREAALEDAETLEEILNAPRLREAVKSSKAQTVYTEEGYEDSAYDHAGEQKHASDHENHAGHLKQQEVSEGKYKIPSVSLSRGVTNGAEYRDQILHGEEWNDDKKINKEETEEADYSEEEQEHSDEVNDFDNKLTTEAHRNKRENEQNYNTDDSEKTQFKLNDTNLHDGNKIQALIKNFEIPEIDLNSTFLNDQEILEIAKEELKQIIPKKDDTNEKYPYYFKDIKNINKDSPLHYAENLKFIPNKSKGGTEFYDSRAELECPEVDNVDPLPEKLKKDKNPNESSLENEENEQQPNEKGENNFDKLKQQPRLRGLGDKIDCFKAKYFGENPLDNPFFLEELISNPEPVTLPNLSTYKLKTSDNQQTPRSNTNDIVNDLDNLRTESNTDIFGLLDKLRTDQNKLIASTANDTDLLKQSISSPVNITSKINPLGTVSSVDGNILTNVKSDEEDISKEYNATYVTADLKEKNDTDNNKSYSFYRNKEDVTISPYKLREKRASPFIYEPYKIIRESQAPETKKTTTTGNISPLIKQLQTSRVVDRVTRANQEPEKKYGNNRAYKDIGRDDRPKTVNSAEIPINSSINSSTDRRRGELKYELRPTNQKTKYTPVENKTSMSVEDYKSQLTSEKSNFEVNTQRTVQKQRNQRQRKPSTRIILKSSEIPSTTEIHSAAASNTIRITLMPTTISPEDDVTELTLQNEGLEQHADSDEEYQEYDEEDEFTTTTSTTTPKSSPRRRRIFITTKKPLEEQSSTQAPKLRLITRFRNHNVDDILKKPEKQAEQAITTNTKRGQNEEFTIPKYREKKKKSSKSTLVTDTQKYGDDDDDMKREEVDALIGLKHDIDDYIPFYEKEAKNSHEQSEETYSEESTEDDNDDEEDDTEESEDDEEEARPETTTPEPTKRTLIRTTEAPIPTVASSSVKIKQRPTVSKKTIEVHNETPINKSLPHITEFKQDIKEIEIIKEIPQSPKRKPEKHTEVFDLYKDDNLAININKLGDVEVFKENLDFKNGPRHGGNYRQAPQETITRSPQTQHRQRLRDAVAAQSENTKRIELNERPNNRMHGGNLKSINDYTRPRSSGRNAKLIELSDSTQIPPRAMHGGNLRLDSNLRRGKKKYEKLTELDDDRRDEDSTSKDDNYRTYSSKNGGAMHGGNYRSAKIVQDKDAENEYDIKVRGDGVKDVKRNAAVLLNSFVQAVPMMTTTPAYILDPSKRMYYYVEA